MLGGNQSSVANQVLYSIWKKNFLFVIVFFLISVTLLPSRKLTDSTDQPSAVPAKLCCRILGHLSAVYCVLFDRTGQYIFTVCWENVGK